MDKFDHIRVFPRRTKWTPDDWYAYVGYPPLFKPGRSCPVRISVVFTWDIPLAEKLKIAWEAHYDDVQIGGPAYGDKGGDFVPGKFIKDGVTITSRGCVRRCPWCFVPEREGRIRELDIQPGHIVQDNNLLACSRNHIEAVFEMLKDQNAATFSGGLDTRLLKDWHIELSKTIKIHELWFACDTADMIPELTKTAKIFDFIKPHKRRCYTMIGFEGELLYDAEARLETVFELGFFPFCQLYQGEEKKEYSKPWRDLQRKWSRPAAYNRKSETLSMVANG